MQKPPPPAYDLAPPKPASLIQSLRAVGYSLPTAIADIIDNSIVANASEVRVDFFWDGASSRISILDNGSGMNESGLHEAMRPGSRDPLETRDPKDLGRFGLGLKTASFSQCLNLCVLSKTQDGNIAARTWDLDYVTANDEWRLLLDAADAATPLLKPLRTQKSGTAVVWSKLDHLVGAAKTADAVAHKRFNDAIDEVQRHLALTFHRFIEDKSLKIFINGNALAPWNPFMDKHHGVYRSPEEHVPFHSSTVVFQGYVLPHKDKLTTEEFERHAGPEGWNSQQGFYVYRNRRLLICGDWLGLGRPTPWTLREEFRLARIRLDIGNSTDKEWQLDVKKSTAQPPALIRARLTDLAENIRNQARSVFAHRGRYGTRPAPARELVRPWLSIEKGGRRAYRINREHPLVCAVLQSVGQTAPEVERLMRLLEETVPVQQIWLDSAEQTRDSARPYEHVDLNVIRSDMRRTLEFLLASGINPITAIERIRSMEPFIDHPKLVNELTR